MCCPERGSRAQHGPEQGLGSSRATGWGQEKHFGGLVNTQAALIYPGEAPGIYVPKGQRIGSSRLRGQERHGHMAWTGRDRDTPGMDRERQGHLWHGQGEVGTPLVQAGRGGDTPGTDKDTLAQVGRGSDTPSTDKDTLAQTRTPLAQAGRGRDTPGTDRDTPGPGRDPLAQTRTPWARAALTCRTMGSCSGGLRFSTPMVSHTWKAVSCSAKKGLCWGGKGGVQAGVKHQGVLKHQDKSSDTSGFQCFLRLGFVADTCLLGVF